MSYLEFDGHIISHPHFDIGSRKCFVVECTHIYVVAISTRLLIVDLSDINIEYRTGRESQMIGKLITEVPAESVQQIDLIIVITSFRVDALW